MKSAGFTLVELMVAITIGIIILGALSQVFVTSRSTYTTEEGLARVQENGRFAMNFITEDIRMAGYIGCQDQAGGLVNQLNDPSGDYWPLRPPNTPSPVVTGFNYTGGGSSNLADWTPALPGAYFAVGEVEPFTDVIMIRRGSDESLRVVASPGGTWMNLRADDLYIPMPNDLRQWDIVMVADCEAADLFQITNATTDIRTTGRIQHTNAVPPPGNGPGNVGPALSQSYGSNAEIFSLVTHAYFIGTGDSTGTNVGNTVPALFRKQIGVGGVAAAEMVDNVESLQVFFGIDSGPLPGAGVCPPCPDGVADQYLEAHIVDLNPANWITVASVRVGLLVRTPDEHGVDVDNNTYNVAGAVLPAYGDRRQRRVFTSTINVRNYTLFTRGS
ncbi:MAG: PilW family protein [Gammaproteobacteria bacterium]|nr:PilW family protein [Gammaproteobacteria bacterium]